MFRRGKRERERSREWWETKHICWPEHEIASYILIYSCVFLCTTCTLIHISSCSDPTNGDVASGCSLHVSACVLHQKHSHVHPCSSSCVRLSEQCASLPKNLSVMSCVFLCGWHLARAALFDRTSRRVLITPLADRQRTRTEICSRLPRKLIAH